MHCRKRPPKCSQSPAKTAAPIPTIPKSLIPKEPNPDGKTYHNQVYRFRTLENLTLYNCTITNSYLKDCKLVSCDIGNSYPEPLTIRVLLVWARNCEFTNCSIASSKIVWSQIDFTSNAEEKVIQGSIIETSKLQAAVVQNSDLLACQFERCQLYDSVINEYKLSDTLVRRCYTSRTISLRKLPSEIRIIIFSYCDLPWVADRYEKFDWNYGWRGKGRSPALVAAFRVDSLLYGEVLEAFYKFGVPRNKFRIDAGNILGRREMSPAIWQTITCLDLEADQIFQCHLPAPNRPWQSRPDFSTLKLRDLRVYFSFDLMNSYSRVHEFERVLAAVQLLVVDSTRMPRTLERLEVHGFISSGMVPVPRYFEESIRFFEEGLKKEGILSYNQMPLRPMGGFPGRWIHKDFAWVAADGLYKDIDQESFRKLMSRWKQRP